MPKFVQTFNWIDFPRDFQEAFFDNMMPDNNDSYIRWYPKSCVLNGCSIKFFEEMNKCLKLEGLMVFNVPDFYVLIHVKWQ